MTTLRLLTLLGLIGLGLAGCNTMAGLGEDTQAGGRALERSADEVREDL